jgi:hypothetical protein
MMRPVIDDEEELRTVLRRMSLTEAARHYYKCHVSTVSHACAQFGIDTAEMSRKRRGIVSPHRAYETREEFMDDLLRLDPARMAEKKGVSLPTIYYYAGKYGIDLALYHKERRVAPRAQPPPREDLIRLRYGQRMGYREMQQYYGVSYGVMKRWARVRGLPPWDNSDAQGLGACHARIRRAQTRRELEAAEKKWDAFWRRIYETHGYDPKTNTLEE